MSNCKKCPSQQIKAKKDLLVESNLNKIKVMRLRKKQKMVARKNEILIYPKSKNKYLKRYIRCLVNGILHIEKNGRSSLVGEYNIRYWITWSCLYNLLHT